MSFEMFGIPQFAKQLSEPGDQLEALVSRRSCFEDVHVVGGLEEIVSDPFHMRQRLEDHVHIVIGLQTR